MMMKNVITLPRIISGFQCSFSTRSNVSNQKTHFGFDEVSEEEKASKGLNLLVLSTQSIHTHLMLGHSCSIYTEEILVGFQLATFYAYLPF